MPDGKKCIPSECSVLKKMYFYTLEKTGLKAGGQATEKNPKTRFNKKRKTI